MTVIGYRDFTLSNCRNAAPLGVVCDLEERWSSMCQAPNWCARSWSRSFQQVPWHLDRPQADYELLRERGLRLFFSEGPVVFVGGGLEMLQNGSSFGWLAVLGGIGTWLVLAFSSGSPAGQPSTGVDQPPAVPTTRTGPPHGASGGGSLWTWAGVMLSTC